jgi:hypothetical protein
MFSSHPDYYSKAVETRPLEVPPDLDTPPSANELVVPNTGPGAASAARSAPAVPAGTELHVDGGVQETWERVGSVLQRSKIGSVGNRDEAAHAYTFDFDAEVEAQNSGESHWYSAVLHHLGFGEGEHIKHVVTVRVSDDNGGSRISVDGNGSDHAATYAAQRTGKELSSSISGATAIVAAAVAAPAVVPPAAAAAPVAPVAAPPPSVTTAPPAISGESVGGMDLPIADHVPDTFRSASWGHGGSQIG